MHTEVRDRTCPHEVVMDLLAKVANPDSRQRKSALRLTKRVLTLARSRGFTEVDDLLDLVRQEKTPQTPVGLKRSLSTLFEYVSADEFAHMVRGFGLKIN